MPVCGTRVSLCFQFSAASNFLEDLTKGRSVWNQAADRPSKFNEPEERWVESRRHEFAEALAKLEEDEGVVAPPV